MELEPCLPPTWARGGHTQTILGHLLPSPQLKFKGTRFEVGLTGGDRMVAFLDPGDSTTVVYLFHGLAGNTDSTYMHRTALLAHRLGHSVIMVNHRGCGEGAGLAKGPYHSGRAEDLSAVLAAGKARFPRHRHLAIGFSLSGNALLLLLTGARGDVKPDAAIAVNAPIHLELCSRLLGQGLNRIYDIKFFRQCRRDVLAAGVVPPQKIPALASIYEFDNLYTAPAGGFANREDYYQSCSTHTSLERIQTPTYIFTTKDDPFVPFASYAKAKLSSEVRLHVENHGGHMGYLNREKTPFGSRRWQDYALFEALKKI